MLRLGRLENNATIMPMMGHFLNNIRHLSLLATDKGHTVRISRRAKKDLQLSQKFIKKAKQGLSMNLLVF